MTQYNFEWDPKKAGANLQKHGVRFEQASTVFRDPRMVSLYDNEHSQVEDRWLTLGMSASGAVLVVHHTFDESEYDNVRVRIFSSRKATASEINQYME